MVFRIPFLSKMLHRSPSESPTGTTEVRFAGCVVDDACHAIHAVMLATSGTGIELKCDIVAAIRMNLPPEIAQMVQLLREQNNLYRHSPYRDATKYCEAKDTDDHVPSPSAELTSGQPAEHAAIPTAMILGRRLAEFEDATLRRLLQKARMPVERLLAVGVWSPGMWHTADGERFFQPFADSAAFAELSGVNVIDDFPSRDLAVGGLGGPLTPLADWILLHHELRNRLVIELGPTLRLAWFPKPRSLRVHRSILAGDIAPGLSLCDAMRRRTPTPIQFTPPSNFRLNDSNVQNNSDENSFIHALLAQWSTPPLFSPTLPCWSPDGISPEPWLNVCSSSSEFSPPTEPFQIMASCAVPFFAAAIRHAVHTMVPEDIPIDELILDVPMERYHGGYGRSGDPEAVAVAQECERSLTTQLADVFPGIPCYSIQSLGVSSEWRSPASVALLARFFIDRTPSSFPASTGANAPRVLGRLTPGAAAAFERLIRWMNGEHLAARTLRSTGL